MSACCEHDDEPLRAANVVEPRAAAAGESSPLHVAPDPLPDEEEILNRDQAPGETPTPPQEGASSTVQRWLAWAVEQVGVPDVVSQDRPSLEKVWRYARYSEQVPPEGPARWFSIGYAGLSLTMTALAYTLAWVAERPARLGTAAVLFTVLAVWLA